MNLLVFIFHQNIEKLKEMIVFKRRKRISRPFRLIIFGIAFLIFPFLNYFGTVYSHRLHWYEFSLIIKNLKMIEIFLILFSFVVGIGILMVKRWGFRSFVLYSLLLILYNIKIIYYNPVFYNINALIQTLIAFSAIAYFLQKDISAPYFKNYPRGWRFQKRNPIQIDIEINNSLFRTRDISPRGFYVDFPNCIFETEKEVDVRLFIENIELNFKAGVVRVDENGAGFAFRGLTGVQIKLLKRKFRDE